MGRHRRSEAGFTLVEMLIAIAVFGIVMVIAYAAIGSSLRVQSDQEALTSAQGKLRRVMEVLTQDLRSAVFGSITGSPYLPADDQVSFMMLTGGAGHPVLPPPSGTDFAGSNQFTVQMPDASHLSGRQIVMIDSHSGTGVIKPVTAASEQSSGIWRISSSCRNTLQYDSDDSRLLIFEISTVGLRYSADDGTLFLSEGDADELPFAFGLSGFRIEYVYAEADGETTVRSEPYLGDSGTPVRTHHDGGASRELRRIQFIAEADSESRGRVTGHAYTGQVDLSRNEHYRVEEIVPCI